MNDQPENMMPAETSGELPKFSVGTVLREARERLGLSVADVANRIKFAPRQIEAMEADDFAHLPEMTFVRGFVRSYARLLEIDATPLLAALPQKHTQLSSVPEKKSVEVPFSSVLTARRSNIVWLAAALFVALVLVIFSRMHDSPNGPSEPVAQTNIETLELPAAAMGAVSAPAADVSAEPAVANAEVAVPKQLESVRAPLNTPAVKVPAAEMQVAKSQAVVSPKDKVTAEKAAKDKKANDLLEKTAQEKAAKDKLKKEAAAKVPAAAVHKSAASGLASMRLLFDQDSWVDVKDANGKILLSKMNHAGSLVRLSGTAPLSVVIGHASAVQLYFEGKKIDLAPYTAVEVARLVLE